MQRTLASDLRNANQPNHAVSPPTQQLTNTTMVEEDPTQRLGLLHGIRKRKLVVLVDMVGKPKRDTRTLKQVMRRTALVELDRGGDPTVRVYLEEPFFLLLIVLE